MSGLINCDGCGGTLTISNVSLNDTNGRWCAYDLGVLLTDKADRGTDLLMPGAAGRRPKRRRYDPTRYLLPIVFTGYVDENGDVTTGDVQAQLVKTMRTFMAGVLGDPSPSGSGNGTRPAVYTLDDGTKWSGDIHTLRLRRRETMRGVWDGDLEISVPLEWSISSS